MRRVREDVTLVPNAADVEHFRQAYGRCETANGEQSVAGILSDGKLSTGKPDAEATDICTPSDLPSGFRHLIGFVGGIGDWIDVSLLARLAAGQKESALVLIGPVETDVQALKSLPNVFLLGRKPYGSLPDYIRHFEVCLSPFRINELTLSVNPVKVYEYLAAGKPVVSTALPEVTPFAPVVSVAKDEESFIEAVRNALATDSPEKRAERLALAEHHSWDARLEPMLQEIQQKLGEK
nr:glycosyltransferase [Heliobacterium chlorum]